MCQYEPLLYSLHDLILRKNVNRTVSRVKGFLFQNPVWARLIFPKFAIKRNAFHWDYAWPIAQPVLFTPRGKGRFWWESVTWRVPYNTKMTFEEREWFTLITARVKAGFLFSRLKGGGGGGEGGGGGGGKGRRREGSVWPFPSFFVDGIRVNLIHVCVVLEFAINAVVRQRQMLCSLCLNEIGLLATGESSLKERQEKKMSRSFFLKKDKKFCSV